MIARAIGAGVPSDLIPAEVTTVTVGAEIDAENELRSAVLNFMAAVRAAEQAVIAERAGAGPITADEWRRHLA